MGNEVALGQYSFQFGSVNTELLTDIGIIAFLIIAFIVFIFILRKYLHTTSFVSPKYEKVVLKVMLPKVSSSADEKSNEKNLQQIQEEIAVTETIFGSIGGLRAQRGIIKWLLGRTDDISFEIILDDEKIKFYVAVPKYLHAYVEQQIHGQYPEAHIEREVDYNIFKPKGVVLGSYITLKKPYLFPIKTYKKLESDPLNGVLSTFNKFDKDEDAAIQILIRSAHKKWRSWGINASSKMYQGKKLKDSIRATNPSGLFRTYNEIIDLFRKKKKDETGTTEVYKPSTMEEEAAKAIEEKSNKAGLDVNIRVVVSSTNAEKARMRLNDINNSFTQFNIYEYGNAFQARLIGNLKKLVKDFIHRNFNEKAKIILNSEEMASIFHFPLPFTEAPNIDWLLAKKSGPPLNIPQEGIVLGFNDYRGRKTEIRIKDGDRRRHMYIIGMTGTGKSVFAEGLAIQDIVNGKGVCYIDPHGDAIDAILQYVPKERAEDVILFDPANVERPMGLNMLEYESEEQKLFVVDTILQIFDKLYDLKATGGPMFEQYMRNSLMLIMDDPESGMTLAEVSKVLADEDYRKLKLSRCKTQVVKDFWEKEALKAGGEASLQNMVPYITSKLTPFIANDLMRPIISQQKSAFQFGKAMNEGKIILCKLSKGKIGDLNANLLGMIMINKILLAALGRANVSEEERTDFYLYIDEFQNFLTDSIEIILSEARKYKLNLIIAHQYLGQLVKGGDTKFKDAIFGNVGTKVSFRIGVDDSEHLTKEFAPVFSEYDFLNCPKYNCFCKLLIDNANPPPFNMQTYYYDHFADGNKERGKAIAELSALKFGKERSIVDAEIRQRQLSVEQLAEEEGPSVDNMPDLSGF